MRTSSVTRSSKMDADYFLLGRLGRPPAAETRWNGEGGVHPVEVADPETSANSVEVNRPVSAGEALPGHGSTRSITKYIQSDGTTVFASREYDAFGNLIPNAASGTWPGLFGYQGQAWQEILSADGAQRLLMSHTRLYDPADGRFLTRDPLRLAIPPPRPGWCSPSTSMPARIRSQPSTEMAW